MSSWAHKDTVDVRTLAALCATHQGGGPICLVQILPRYFTFLLSFLALLILIYHSTHLHIVLRTEHERAINAAIAAALAPRPSCDAACRPPVHALESPGWPHPHRLSQTSVTVFQHLDGLDLRTMRCVNRCFNYIMLRGRLLYRHGHFSRLGLRFPGAPRTTPFLELPELGITPVNVADEARILRDLQRLELRPHAPTECVLFHITW